MSKVAERNEPLGLQHVHARTSSSSLPSPYPQPPSRRSSLSSRISRRSKPPEKKLTADGKIVLDPQPDDSLNDPLNWPAFRRDMALLSLGLYCMIGGGMTPILAAGFSNVAASYHISTARVALSTGLYMMGLGIGSVVASPTAILYGKRPVYLVASVLFIVSAVWCAVSPNFPSLIVARIFQGIAVSPVECLPSATIAEIFFLHERAYRLGIYTLLLLGGKNLVPLVSAVVINSLGWRWVFWIVAMVVGFCGVLLFFFVPETFWDRTPRPRRFLRHHEHAGGSRPSMPRMFSMASVRARVGHKHDHEPAPTGEKLAVDLPHTPRHVGFADGSADVPGQDRWARREDVPLPSHDGRDDMPSPTLMHHDDAWKVVPLGNAPPTPQLHNLNSPFYVEKSEQEQDYFALHIPPSDDQRASAQEPNLPKIEEGAAKNFDTEDDQKQDEKQNPQPELSTTHPPAMTLTLPTRTHARAPSTPGSTAAHPLSQMHTIIPSPDSEVIAEKATSSQDHDSAAEAAEPSTIPSPVDYTAYHRDAPPKTYLQTLKPYSGRLSKDKWIRAAIRPFILYAYPSILWSALVYSLSVGWLIVLSETVSVVYRDRDSYNFTALQTGLVYLSPFIGGILGTAVAGKVSDLIVRAMARRNQGIYEPEFRLIMAAPVAFTTVMGLMGFGWSAQERDMWFVPTFFFGVISFGCSLGSTTAITFAVDCYRGYAGEALVTLNFSKSKILPRDARKSNCKLIRSRHLSRTNLLALLHLLA